MTSVGTGPDRTRAYQLPSRFQGVPTPPSLARALTWIDLGDVEDDDDTQQHEAGEGTSWSAPGATLDRFLVLGALGSGGMGVVLSAHDPTLDRCWSAPTSGRA